MSKLIALYQKKIGPERKDYTIEIDGESEITKDTFEKLDQLALLEVGLPYIRIASWIRENKK